MSSDKESAPSTDKQSNDSAEDSYEEYTIQLTTDCDTEAQRLALEKELMTILKELDIDENSVDNQGDDTDLSMSWEGDLSMLGTLRTKLHKVAKAAGICFEVDLETGSGQPETYFIGTDADNREVDYLLERLDHFAPRLLKRVELIASRCELDLQKLKGIFNVLTQIPSQDTSRNEEKA